MAVRRDELQDQSPVAQLADGVTLRAVGIGIVLVVMIDLLATYGRYYFHISRMALSHVPMAMLMVFFVMIIGFSIVSRHTRVVLSSGEWHTLLAMGLVGATLPGYSTIGWLIGRIAAPYYYATPENNWVTNLHPYLPNFVIPSNEGNAMGLFFEGLPTGASIPWGVWVMPMFWWFMAFTAAFVALACVATIFRKQWVQNERLAFPTMAPLLDMMSKPGDGKKRLPEFMQNRMFWIGFAISFGMLSWNCINYFLPNFPRFPIHPSGWRTIDPQYPQIRASLGLFNILFSYFASLDVLFSIWIFDLMFIVEAGWLNTLGYTSMNKRVYRGVYIWQTRGAFVALVISMFWVARRHLRDVVLNALGKDDTVDDREELMSYRAALIGLVGGLAYLFIFLLQMNIDPIKAVMLLGGTVFCYVGIAKILSDTGMPYIQIPVLPWGFVGPFFGNRGIDAYTQIAGRFAGNITNHGKGLFLPAMAQAGRVAEGVPGDRRKLMGAMFVAFLVSFIFSVWLTISMGYAEGAFNFNVQEIPKHAQNYFKNAANTIKFSNRPPFYEKNPAEFSFFGLGGLAMAGLLYLRHRFAWWPVHPVGLALSGTALVRQSSFTVFVAWLIKLLMLKVGGPSVYRKSRPLFIGLLVGYVLAIVLSTVLDVTWFPDKGHVLHFNG